jgi:ribosomal protein S18 acetylase RimI-like enzyme
MTSHTITAYATDHAERILELALDAWAPVFASFQTALGDDLYERVHPNWKQDQARSVRAALDTNETWVAIADGDVTGFVNVVFDQTERSGEIYMLAVDPRAQRQGIASALTEFALDEMRARGLTLAVVATGGDAGHAPARATYQKAGFTGCPQVWYAKQLT